MTQAEALTILKTGANVFLTGEAGSGKTHTINQYTAYLREHEIDYAVTASTGIAATHIHGMTIHSWSGIGIARTMDKDLIQDIAENGRVTKRIKKAKVLIIDEISMLDGNVFALVEAVCRRVRKGHLPFGGLQVIVVGDFFQLPPVTTGGQTMHFAFESDAWHMIGFRTCYLTEQHRQEDEAFLEVLTAIRGNACLSIHRERIEMRMLASEELPENTTRLFSHNVDVDKINALELRKLPGKTYGFTMADRGPAALTDALKRGCLSPERLELKDGAVVMFTKNNPNEGFANGTLGTVIGFDSTSRYPIVETHHGRRILVEPMEWVIAEGEETLAKVIQLPLRLAWAMTIHKSQGVSLDAAVIDLSQTFEFGQGYVALSRVRRLSGVHLIGLNDRAFEVHPIVLEQDCLFREDSRVSREIFGKYSKEKIHELEHNFIIVCGGKIDASKKMKEKTLKKVSKKKSEEEESYSLEKIREKHTNAYRAWNSEEEKELKRLFSRGKQMKEMAEKLGRKPGAIRARIKKLGLTEV